MELEIKGVGATIPDHGHLWGGARSGSSGPEVLQAAEGWLKGEGWTRSGEPARLSRAATRPLPALILLLPLPVPSPPPQLGAHSTRSPAVSLTRVPWADDPMWARRWPGMKSSRLSPAGRLWGGACMLGSRLEGCSSACPLRGRKKEGGALLGPGCPCPLGSTLGLWEGGGRASWVGAQRPRKQAAVGTRLSGCLCRLLEAQWAAC